MVLDARPWDAIVALALSSAYCASGCTDDTHHDSTSGGTAGALTEVAGSAGQSTGGVGNGGAGTGGTDSGGSGGGGAGAAGAAGASPADAGPSAPPDASTVDAGPDLAGTLTFGERLSSRFQGVTADTEVRSNVPDSNYGAMDEIASDSQPDRLSLIRFDLSVIPPGRVVTSAVLQLWTKGVGSGCDSTADASIPLYPLLESWEEGQGSAAGEPGFANWTYRREGVLWAAPGLDVGTRSATPAATFGPVALDTEHSIPLDLGVVQGWLDPSTNFGLIFWFKPADSNGVCFLTSEAADPTKRPQLSITLE